VKVVFAAAEAAPVARVGGLAEAAGGLIRSLRTRDDVELIVVLPDYDNTPLENESIEKLSVPKWVGSAMVRTGIADELGEVHLVRTPELARPHPYVDKTGVGWSDNHQRFFGFSAAVAAIVEKVSPDLVHLNDWHTAMTLAYTDIPSVYTIHTLGYQGHGDLEWLKTITTDRGTAFDRFGELNPSAGAIRLADKVIAVSPNYAAEILEPSRGAGLHTLLASKGTDLVGVRNGIDAALWSPATDRTIAEPYDSTTLEKKAKSSTHLANIAGWNPEAGPIIGVVSRLVEQKGIDILLGLVPYLRDMGTRIFMLGSGEERLALWARQLATTNPEVLHFVEAYDLELAHQIFAGSSLFCMPSRFEPCGLAQMQAMAYGTIPVVTPVGGLVDTVVDADAFPETGTGFVASTVDGLGVLDALHRSLTAWRNERRRLQLQKRGMTIDWSWERPAQHHVELYREILG